MCGWSVNDCASSMDFPLNTLMTGPASIAICVIYNLRRGFFPLYHRRWRDFYELLISNHAENFSLIENMSVS